MNAPNADSGTSPAIMAFRKAHGYRPDTENPKTYNEKVLRRKLTRNGRIPFFADKARAKDWIRRNGPHGLEVIPSVFPSEYTMPFIIKPTNSSGRNRIIRDEDSWEKAIDFYDKLRKMNYGAEKGEWWYSEIPFQLLYEPLLDIKYELRFFCFHGKAEFIYLRQNEKNSWFTRGGEFLDMRCDKWETGEKQLPDIRNGIQLAEQLSRDWDHVRLDFLYTSGAIYFCEFTFAHRSGHAVWSDPDFDKQLGAYW